MKLNRFDELRARFQAKRDANKPFQSAGPEAMNAGKKRASARPKCADMYDANGFFNADYKGRII